MATATHSFIQQSGKIYFGTTGVVANALVTTARQIAELDGDVTFDQTFTRVQSRWRTKNIVDSEVYGVDMSLTLNGVQFRTSTLKKLMTAVSSGQKALYGTTATANFVQFRSSTTPLRGQFVFDFVRTSDKHRMQVYCPKAEVNNFPMPFSVADFTKQNLTFTLMATTAGTLYEILTGVTSAA